MPPDSPPKPEAPLPRIEAQKLPRPQRLFFLGLGYACLGLAALGAVLPVMPTTIFLIGAVWAFGRASPTLRARLLNDPRIGPTLRDWQQHGAVSPRAKRAAVLAMALSWALVTIGFRSLLASVVSGLCMVAVAAWLLTRPSAPPMGVGPDAA